MNITKQFSVLEDIYRLLEYLDYLADNEKLHLLQAGYPANLERYNVLWDLMFKIKNMKPYIVDTYVNSFEDITGKEKRDLRKWVANGSSIFSNPYMLSDESGRPMDFINACRSNDVLYEQYLASCGEATYEIDNFYALDDDLPF